MVNLKGIYAVTPDGLKRESLLRKVEDIYRAGIKIVQYRNKTLSDNVNIEIAKELLEISKKYKGTLIINDDPYIAKTVGAKGVHLGQKDISLKKARQILGPNSLIGISCQNNLDLALKAQAEGANYVAIGSVYETKTKKSTVKASLPELYNIVESILIPVVAIGGINSQNIKNLARTNVDMFAISSGLFKTKDCNKTAKSLLKLIK